ncbi:flippase [Paenibacillus sp. J31TS4]|uniref:flippase n=1 Tax=Paenibacillus sp. J31TS4 TaxID=2807195 RepID=UPI001BCFF16F|nr:flippase [Paenibacillus sp. J31TS4]
MNNTTWMLFDKVIRGIVNLILLMLIARYLGPNNYGLLTFSLSIIAIFSVISSLGLEGIIIKYFVSDPQNKSVIVGTCIILRTVSSALSIIAILIFIIILQPEDKSVFYIAFVQSLSLLFSSLDVIDFWFQSKLQSKYISLARIISTTLVTVFKLMLIMFNSGVFLFALTSSVEVLIVSIIIFGVYRKYNSERLLFSWELSKNILSQSYHFIISGLLISLYTQMDKIMIGKMINQSSVGIYSAATTLSDLWIIIPITIINSARPIIMESFNKDKVKYLRQLKQLYSIVIWLGIIVALLFKIFGSILIHMFYGISYIEATEILQITIWSSLFALLGGIRVIWLVCEDKVKYNKYCVGVGGTVNLLMNFLTIPIWGINGAAFSTLIAQVIVQLIAPLFFKEMRISVKHLIEALLLYDNFSLKINKFLNNVRRFNQ